MNPHATADLFTLPPLWLAVLIAALVAGAASKARLLTGRGAIAAFVVGSVIFGLGGGRFAVPLLTFFFTSSLLSKMGKRRKAKANAQAVKGDVRDAGQVLANGGAATLLVLIFALVVRHWPLYQTRNLLMLYLAALASVNADTWATELGALSRTPPRLLSNWKPVSAGTSGAVTMMGLLASLAGAAVVALAGYSVWHLDFVEFFTVTWAGFLGSLSDSVLGAGVQVLYRDPISGDLTERTVVEGRKTEYVRGIPWINNDGVNFLCSLFGVLCAWLMLQYGAGPFR